MDFIEQLPISSKMDTIWVIVDWFTKYSHFIALAHPFTASSLAKLFLDTIDKLHGLPHSIVSDRDKVFTSQFWTHLFKLIGIQQSLSTAYHPHTDGQTEHVNQCLESYLRCMCGTNPKRWADWLPMAELWYNTAYHTALQLSPFEALYGFKPTPWVCGSPNSTKTDRTSTNQIGFAESTRQDEVLCRQKSNLPEFQEGDWVYLKLKPYRHQSLHPKRLWKLSPKFAGPFQITARVGQLAYRLNLPATAKLHLVFHVSLLKKQVGPISRVANDLPEFDNEGKLLLQPVRILSRRLVKRGNSPATQLLVQWAHLPDEEATWEFLDDLKARFPDCMSCG